MSIRVTSWVWENADLSGGMLLTLLAVADFAHDDGGGAYPSMAALARKARLSVRQSQRAIKRLTSMGYLEADYGAGPNSVNIYRVVMTAPLIAASQSAEMSPRQDVTPDKMSPRHPCHRGGDTHVTGGVTPMSPNPSSEPSSEPSENIQDITLPTWWETLSKDRRWGTSIDLDFIRDIDSIYGQYDLVIEARRCYQWLQDSSKGQRRKEVRRVWLNWCKNMKMDVEPAVVIPSIVPSVDLSRIDGESEAIRLWEQSCLVLKEKVPLSSYNTFFADLHPLGFVDGGLVLSSNRWIATQIMKRSIGLLEDVIGCRVRLSILDQEGSPAD